MFAHVNLELAKTVAEAIGANEPKDGGSDVKKSSPALSLENMKKTPETRKVGVLIGNGFNGSEVTAVLDALKDKGVQPEIVSEKLGKVKASDGKEFEVDHTFLTSDSVLFDALYAVGGEADSKKFVKEATSFIEEAYTHYKPIGATHEGTKLLKSESIEKSAGVITGDDPKAFAKDFLLAITAHRHWDRQIV